MMVSKSTINHKRLADVSFSVAARLAMQLGRESISNSITAIIELVKNSYDADAENVNISFHDLNTPRSTLIVEDDGNGMTISQLSKNWMLIGTSNKQGFKKSQRKKRVLTGEKGLGRLGLDRLCKKTTVQFFSTTKSDGIEIVIDWSKFEKKNTKLEKVKHPRFKIPKFVIDPSTKEQRRITKGTRLILTNLKDSWTLEYLEELKRELSLLVSPWYGINDFAIHLDSGQNLKEIDGKISSEKMLNAAEWKLVATIDFDNKVSYRMSSSLYGEVFKLKPTPWSKKIHKRGKMPDCGTLRFEMYFFQRNPEVLKKLNLESQQIDRFLDANQGIRIYRDGFRVKPYGQPNGEGDWLTLSYRRMQSPAGVGKDIGSWRVGYNQVVGAVFIERNRNRNLLDQTNREGIVEAKAYYDLRAFASDAIRFFEVNRQKFEHSRKSFIDYNAIEETVKKTTEESISAVQDLKDARSKIKEILDTAKKDKKVPDTRSVNTILSEAVKKVDNTVTEVKRVHKKFAKATQEQTAEFQRQKDTLSNLASLGILTSCFGHETLASSNLVLINAKQLSESLAQGLFMVPPDINDEINENMSFIINGAERIETFADFVLKNMTRDKRKRKSISLEVVARKVFSSFETSLGDKNIDYKIKPSRPVSNIHGFEIDWESIFVNMITNSVWAIVEGPQRKNRIIRVSFNENEKYISIRFADSGKGLEAGTEDKIFLPTFSTKRNAKGEVIGTGMGLTIVKSFVEDYDGASIRVKSPCDLGGAEFQIRIPHKASNVK
ncbi:MAG: sensor histidine kinase [Sedimentisphaerales bacterium]|nr:sensor histidine kinase [Sedimentisphaerales bacterium]